MSAQPKGKKPYPTYDELAEYLIKNPKTSFPDIGKAFDFEGEMAMLMPKPGCKRKKWVIGYPMDYDFGMHLIKFMREDYVKLYVSMLMYSITADKMYKCGKSEEFIPMLLYIDVNKYKMHKKQAVKE